MRTVALFLYVVAVATAAAAPSAPPSAPPEKFLAAFAPMDGGPAALSPDGKHLAYAVREKGEAAVYVLAVATHQITFRAVVGNKVPRYRLLQEPA